jgi:hypothetical protein
MTHPDGSPPPASRSVMSDQTFDQRMAALEARLERIEDRLGRVVAGLERATLDLGQVKTGIQAWVTDYVSLRLQQLVPETCEHPEDPADAVAEGPRLPGTRIRCTDDVLHRLGRIPIPFVRQMVTQKVAETAQAENVAVVDVAFFERAATF